MPAGVGIAAPLLVTLTVRCPEPQRHGATGQRSPWLWAVKRRERQRVLADLDAQLRAILGWQRLVLTKPTKRRVTFTRGLGVSFEVGIPRYSNGKLPARRRFFRAYDLGNYLAALKQVEDVMQRPRERRPGLGLLWDDNPKWMQAEYRQEKGDVAPGMLRIDVWETP